MGRIGPNSRKLEIDGKWQKLAVFDLKQGVFDEKRPFFDENDRIRYLG
jgi:hypothetical protein